MTPGRFEGRVAAVIGGGSGKGAAISRRLGSEGAHVYVADLNESSATAVAVQIGGEGGKATARFLDAVQISELKDLYDEIEAEHGVLHLSLIHI